MLHKMILLGAAGALGTLCRFGLSGLVQRLGGGSFPWGTLSVNVLGCFLFGLVWTLGEERMLVSGEHRLIILAGFMGAFTTFSTFGFESAQLLQDAEYLLAAANLAVQNVLGIVFVILGITLGRLF